MLEHCDTIQNYYYKNKLYEQYNTNIMKIIRKEYSMFIELITVHFDSSIFVKINNSDMRSIRVLITGPKDTPYESGCFIFDIFIPLLYPQEPPLVQFMNSGGNRFNPNLYANGKVCLSLLNTWHGHKYQKWNKDISNIAMVLIAIQSQILVENPYFNEPGYETHMGTETGNNLSYNYNCNIVKYTIDHGMCNLLKNNLAYPEFNEIISRHFKLKSQKITKTLKNWIDKYKLSDSYVTKINNFIK